MSNRGSGGRASAVLSESAGVGGQIGGGGG